MDLGFLLIVSGPAGVGKGTVCNALLEDDKDVVFSVSSTTRKPRVGEVDGVNYNFIDREDFEAKISRDEFLEYAFVHTDYYGTSKDFVESGIKNGKIVLLEIDVQGAIQVKEKHPEAITIFILPPSMEELERRIVDRNTETSAQIQKRMNNAYKEIDLVDKYDYYVVNDNLETAIESIEAIIKAEKHKVERKLDLKSKYLGGR